MFINIIKFYKIVIFLIIISFLSGCNNEYEVRIRPKSIPDSALWVGGIDGGVYVIIEKNKNDKPNIYRGVIYHAIGEIDYEGKLLINNDKNPTFEFKNEKSYSGWDGDTLYLIDGRKLKIPGK